MSVLRYAGGKNRAIKILDKYIPKNIKTLYSPFVGGGSFELFVRDKYKAKIYANDKFEPLCNFWSCAQEDKTKLIEEVKKLHPIDKKIFVDCRTKLKDLNNNKFVRAACYFAINRSSFSGSTLSGGFSKEAGLKRFNESSIKKLNNLNLDNTTFSNQDFTIFLENMPNNLDNTNIIFLDPPYYLGKNSKLYGNKGDLHEDFDHEKLYDLIKNKKNWILCYNDCEFIRNLYKDYKINDASWSYGMNKTKKSSEIIITNS